MNLYHYAGANPLRFVDPKGLYSVTPPNAPESEKINKAIFDVYKKLTKPNPCCGKDVADKMMAFLSDPSLVFEYVPNLGICATVTPETMAGQEQRILVGALAWTPQCKCPLASVILHEMAHAAFQDHGEAGPDSLQLQCYGCQQPAGGQ